MKSQIHEYSKNNFAIMSKKLIIAALLVISASSFAQEQTTKDEKSNKPKREKQTPEQRGQAQLDKLTKELSLNPQNKNR